VPGVDPGTPAAGQVADTGSTATSASLASVLRGSLWFAPSASPSPTKVAAGGNGDGLPVTGTNVWWLVGSGILLLLVGVVLYLVLRPRRIHVAAP
jgi:LPXTG-motif cell wall-anchored protein